MPVTNGPYRDPEEGATPRRHKVPKALARLRRQLTYERKIEVFRDTFGRDPASDEELDAFAEEYVLEMYNAGYDEL